MPSSKDSRYLALAAKIAEKSQLPVRVGAVIVKGSKILAVGVNRTSGKLPSTPRGKKVYYTLHAEIDALLGVENVRRSVVYVQALTSTGALCRSSRPCDLCREILATRGVRAFIYYERGDIVREGI